jgi:hypothetical protein
VFMYTNCPPVTLLENCKKTSDWWNYPCLNGLLSVHLMEVLSANGNLDSRLYIVFFFERSFYIAGVDIL